jgi:hypothetical protein
MSALVFLLCLGGLFGIALAMQKHSRHIFSRRLETRHIFALRLCGWGLVLASLVLSLAQWHAALGTIIWLGVFLVSSFTNTAVLTLMRAILARPSA